MSEHEWKFGDFGILKDKRIVRCVAGQKLRDDALFITSYDSTIRCSPCSVSYLPDCTGFDWKLPKTIEPPEGYRLLTSGEVVNKDDKYLTVGNEWRSVASSIGDVYSACLATMARKIEPTYRPFANAAEFTPFRDLFVVSGPDKSFRNKLIQYNDIGVFIQGIDAIQTWKYMLSVAEFEDGTPFGLKVSSDD